MRFRNLDLNLLVALDTLLSEGKITEAAYHLNLSQSAMSSALARLREYFRDPIFVQVGRKMMPTTLALELQQPVREVLLQIQTRIASRADFDPVSASRTISIASSDYFLHVIGPELTRVLHDAAPKLVLDFWPMDRQAVGRLDRGELDLVVAPKGYLADDKPCADLFTDEFVAIMALENPDIGDRVDAETFSAVGQIVCKFGTDRHSAIDQDFIDRANLTRRCEVTIENFSMLPHMVVGTDRIAVIHRRLAEHYVKLLPIRIAALPFDTQIVESMQWQTFNTCDQLHRWVRSVMKEVIRAKFGGCPRAGANDLLAPRSPSEALAVA